MQQLIVRVAIVALAWMGLSSSASADSIAVTAAFLGSPPALAQLSDFAPRGVGRGLALKTALLSSFAASLPAGDDGFGRGARAVRGSNGSGGGVGGGFGGGVGAGAGLAFMGREGLGATLKPSAAAPSRFTLSTPRAGGAPARTRSRSNTPPVVLSGNGLPLPSEGAAAVGGAQADFAGAPASATPEPATLLLLGAGLAGAAVVRRNRRERHAAD